MVDFLFCDVSAGWRNGIEQHKALVAVCAGGLLGCVGCGDLKPAMLRAQGSLIHTQRVKLSCLSVHQGLMVVKESHEP